MTAEVPADQLLFRGDMESLPVLDNLRETVLTRLDEPTGTKPLRELAAHCSKVLILVDDNTRSTPVDRILPVLLDYLQLAGIGDSCIEILTALGTHRVMTEAELRAKVGEEAFGRVKITQHDCSNAESIVDFGSVQVDSMRIPIQINRKILDADFIIGLGSITPHSDAGFSGGAKIVQPGVCGLSTTGATHIAAALLENIPLGDVENPCRRGMEEVARKVGLDFIVNVVQNVRGDVVAVVAGDFIAAHRRGVVVSRQVYGVTVPAPADVVIVSSHPGDIDWWQAEKSLVAASFAVKRGGTIIFAGPCHEGLAHNHPRLRAWLGASYNEARSQAADIDPTDIDADLVAADVAIGNARVREFATILAITDGLSDNDLALLDYQRMPDLQAAVDHALALVPGSSVGVLPYGGVCLPIVA